MCALCILQSLQALKKISQEHPTACLRAGALMAVLSYLDFFSTGVQVKVSGFFMLLITARKYYHHLLPCVVAHSDLLLISFQIIINHLSRE